MEIAHARPSDIDHLEWLRKAAHSSWQDKRVLDLGCGSGFVCQRMTELGAKHVVGVDLLEPEILRTQEKPAWSYLCVNLDDLQWQLQLKEVSSGVSYDAIFAFDILEHVNSPFVFLQNCRKLLGDKGCLFLTTPNTFSWERIARPTSWSGAHDPQHKTLFHRYSLEFILKKSGFSQVETSAPVRSLHFLGALQPHIGGQIYCLAAP